MRHVARLAALLALGAVGAGCGAETGILVAVTGNAVDELEFQVGLGAGADLLLDHGISGERRDVRGRNLHASPYELLLREEDPAAEPLTVRVLVLGYAAGKIAGVGVTEPPQTFARGEVRRRNVGLTAPGSGVTLTALGKTCFRVQQGKGSWRLHTTTDMDCDGSATTDTPPDCNDADEAIRPGAAEICDGKDNNCDGNPAPTTQPCYGFEPGQTTPCREGTRGCDDRPGGALLGTCVAVGRQAAEAYCREYAKCTGAAPLDCANGHVTVVGRDCTATADAVAGVCEGSLALAPPSGSTATVCRWAIVDAAGWSVTLADPNLCQTKLVFAAGSAAGPAGPVVLELFTGAKPAETSIVVKVKLTLKTAVCGATAFSCK